MEPVCYNMLETVTETDKANQWYRRQCVGTDPKVCEKLIYARDDTLNRWVKDDLFNKLVLSELALWRII